MYPVYVILAAFFSYVLYQRYLSPLAGIPGPFEASLLRTWIARLSWRGGCHKTMVDTHKKYGSLVRIGPNEVSVSNAEAVKKIYAHGTRFRKSIWYSVWQGRRKFDLFAERDEKIHGKQRGLVSHPYSMQALKDLEPYVDNAINYFMERMEEIKSSSIDMGKWVQLFAFDVIGEVTFSKRFGFMDVGNDDGSFRAIETALKSAAWVGQMPWLYWLNDFLTPVFGNRLAINNRHGSIRNIAVREVTARMDRGSDHDDILGKLYQTHKEKPNELDETAVMSMATSNLFAGSDTTAVSIRAIIYYLLKNPKYKQKLMDEIDAKKKQGALSDPVKLSEADAMPYLQAVMYEALRMHPAVGMSLPRVVPEGGFEVDGHFLPAGTIIGANPWVMHQNKRIYGEDVHQFRPERWMEANTADMHRFLFTFGGGARVCIGKNVAWMEMSKLIPTLFMRYNLELTDPDAEWTMSSWWFVMQKGVNVKLTSR